MNPVILKNLFKFSLTLLLAAGISYALHYGVIMYFNFDDALDLAKFAYKFNVGITLIFTSTIILVSELLKEQLGFIFLLGGMVKLGVFLYLAKTLGFDLNKSVFLHFFIPYALCVVVEIIFVTKILNRLNFSNNK